MVLVTVLVCIAVFVFWWLIREPSALKDFPRKKGLPLIGNLLQIDVSKPHIIFTEWAKELGDVFAVDLPHKTQIIVNSYEAIHDILVSRGKDFHWRPTKGYFRIEHLSDGFKEILFSKPTERWRLLRKTCAQKIKMHDSIGFKCIEDLNMGAIKDLLQNFKNHDGSFDAKGDIFHALIDIMTNLLFGRVYPPAGKEVEAVKQLEALGRTTISPAGRGIELDFFPWLRHFGNSTFAKMKKNLQLRASLWSDLYPTLTGGDGIVQALLKLNGSEGIDESCVKTVFDFLLVAGISTTGNTLYIYLNLLAHHPLLAKKIREKVDEAVGIDRQVSLEDRASLPYVMACVYELLRISSVSPFALPHCTARDTHIKNMAVPQNTEVLVNLWALHHNEDLWDEPFKFKAERFLEEDGSLVSASHPNRRHMMAFGAGPRVCVGELLALSRLFLAIASISQVFDVEPSEEKVSWDPRDYESAIILSQKDYKIKVSVRKGSWMDAV